MQKKVLSILLITILTSVAAETITFDNNWGRHRLFNVISETPNGIEIVFSAYEIVIEDVLINDEPMKAVSVPGMFLPSEEGAPNVGGTGRYIAIPQGSHAIATIIDARTEVYHNIELAPAPKVPKENDDSPIQYKKDMQIYSQDAFYPESAIKLSEPTQLRGVDVVLLHVAPLQYNPITKDLVVYKDIRVRINFIGGNSHFGEDRLRSRFWEPILQGNLLNYKSLPKINFYAPERINSRTGYEYIIIVPNDPIFEAWADTIKNWRKLQGISCDVFSLTEVGGSDSAAIKNFLQNAYNTWDPAPVAFLLLSDYPSSGRTYGITSPRRYSSWANEYYISDNWYADYNNDTLPEMHHARICAQDESDLSIMINKFLSYERNPYTAANFSDEPLVAVAWQTERWFQLCGEVIRGFLINSLGKNPARQYAIYQGAPTPGCAWSTYGWTASAVAYWNSLGYVPLTNPYDATWWSNGSATGITNAINSGAFLVQHRDHGYTGGWGEPAYGLGDLNNLTNDMYTFVFSTNCQTGQYNYPSEVFIEKFTRIEHGALGANAPSEVSYSFYNDAYIWGVYDGLWPQFDPGYGMSDMTGSDDLRPCMAMTHGKFYLDAASWGLGPGGKWITEGLFHHFSDAFATLYSEVPTNLTVSHDNVLTAIADSFVVSADNGSVIALTVNGEIIGVAAGTGAGVAVPIIPQTPGNIMKITVTKANYYRYEADVPIISPNYAYLVLGTTIIDDSGADGLVNPGETVDYGIFAKNIGALGASGVYGILGVADPYVTIITDSSWFGDIHVDDSLRSNPDYSFSVAENCPDGHTIDFTLTLHDSMDTTWVLSPDVMVYAALLSCQSQTVSGGSWNNGLLDPAETADLIITLKNEGSVVAQNVTSTLITYLPDSITINDGSANYGSINPGDTVNNASDPFNLTASGLIPFGTLVDFGLIVESGVYLDTINFTLMIGQNPPTDTGYYYAYYSGGAYYQSPVFDWIAIDTTQSTNPGVSLNLATNQTVVVNLPFTFKYYGVNYSKLSISSNGWVALDSTNSTDNSNTTIPNVDGPPKMIAGIWDYLNPGATGPGDIYYYYDAANYRFIVEYFKVDHYPSGNPETFEIILYDPAYYSAPSGNGDITVQYLTGIVVPSSVTIGIENSTQTVGIEYLFNGTYDSLAAAVTDSFAIRYRSQVPLGIGEISGLSSIPMQTLLSAILPNPFGQHINISYQLGRPSAVDLFIYDVSGRLIRSLAHGTNSAGYYNLVWNGYDDLGRRVPAGVYFVHFQAGNYREVKKAVLLR